MISNWHLAQLNIGRIRAPMNDPIMAEFAAALDEINALAEATPGFVWRLKESNGNATSIAAYPDPLVLVNMSVWTDVASLQGFAFRSAHGKFFARRQAWFEKHDGASAVLWWIPAGHLPSIEEAKTRLAMLDTNGPAPDAFTFRQSFPPPSAAKAAS